MQYSMLRFFLTKKEIGPVLVEARDFIEQDRKEHLQSSLEKEIEFDGQRSTRYVYAFVGKYEDVILGRIGRLKPEKETKGPESGFLKRSSVVGMRQIFLSTPRVIRMDKKLHSRM